jgi:hypothetical protein
MFYSSLGITTVPKLDIVLKHLYNIIDSGESLDRWNSITYTMKQTFSDLFAYINEHWSSISQIDKNKLKQRNLIPIGHTLIKPGRLFFRLYHHTYILLQLQQYILL